MSGKRLLRPLGLLVIWTLLSLVAEYFDLDRRWVSQYYESGFFLAEEQPYKWLYEEGTIPSLILTLIAGLGVAGSYLIKRLAPYRRSWLVVLLTALIGGTILINAILKDYWGRPRPRQVVEFGGAWEYLPFYQPGTPGRGESFPCGHCTSGFIFISLATFYRTQPLAAGGAVIGGLVYGVFISKARMVQGGHFPTDAFWSLGLVLASSFFFHLLLVRPQEKGGDPLKDPKKRAMMLGGMVLFIVLATMAFMTRRPYFKNDRTDLPYFDDRIKSIELQMSEKPQSFKVLWDQETGGVIEVEIQGFGWPSNTHRIRYWADTDDLGGLLVKARFDPIGYYSEIEHRVTLHLPKNRQNDLQVTPKEQITPPFN